MRRINVQSTFVVLATSLLCISNVSAATINASSCSIPHVQAAINSASTGDTVVIPAGSCSWSDTVAINKGITVTGSGNGPSGTVLNRTSAGSVFSIKGVDGDVIRLTNMRLGNNAGLSVNGASKDWRIDNIYFDKTTGPASIIHVQNTTGGTDYTNGVIDNCTFYHPGRRVIIILPNNSGSGNQTWNRPLGLGTKDALYIEDNLFDHASFNPSIPTVDGRGENMVFRYNTVNMGYIETHDAIVTNYRGYRKWEIYENDWNTTLSGTQFWGLHIRGGTGVIFNNRWHGEVNANPVTLALYRTYQTGGDPWDVLCSSSSGKACLDTALTYARGCNSDADCGGISGACVDIDGDGSPSGNPCRDQIGTSSGGAQTRGESPALFWNNLECSTYPCTPTTQITYSEGSGSAYYAEGIDYCIGLTTMPSTCNGQATSYTPYTYPHPLTEGQSEEGQSEDAEPPVRSNGSPTGCFFGTTQTTLTLSTNEEAICKYDINSGITFDLLTNTFNTTMGTVHSETITGLTDGGNYTYYVKCKDNEGNTNLDDYTISFSVADAQSDNIALNIIPSVDSSYSGYTPAPLTDGVVDPEGGTLSTWASAESSTNPHWVTIDFGQNETVDTVKIYWAWNYSQSSWMTSQEIIIQSWNGSSYSDITTIANPEVGPNTVVSFTPITTSRIRIYQTANMGPSNYSLVKWLAEIEVFTAGQGSGLSPPTNLIILEAENLN